MRKVSREEIRKPAEYATVREEFRRSVLAQKEQRRIHVGEYLTFLFENHDTVLYQIQEMIRAEGITGEPEIRHEMDTYNELLGDRGELGCTLLIEIDDPAKRSELLSRWKDLPGTLYLQTQSGTRVPAQFDARQVGEDRISSVHYLRFRVGDQVPHKVGCSHPEIVAESILTAEQTAALCRDLL
jgi:Protein of unknown function (DUF3501)